MHNNLFFSVSEHSHDLGLVRRCSSWTTKGRAPAQPDSDTNTGRGKKRVVDDLKNVGGMLYIDDNDNGDYDDDVTMDDPTPKKKGKGKATAPTAKFDVLVDSPPKRCLTQRLWTNEAGDTIDASTMTKEEAENWVATGKVRPK